ncbi:MAG: hypothetical protein MUC63_02215 [Planctomycetes bacterium]|jgi:hypothetical protein|nr:hypothetical protein [Planctomycetota bacterium]
MKASRWRTALLELALLVGSIPLFRGVWLLLDRVEFLGSGLGLALSVAGGIAVCTAALIGLNRCEEEKAPGGKP